MRIRSLTTLIAGFLILPASIALASAGEAATPSTAALTGFLYTGNAYGTYATAGAAVIAGKSAPTTLCTSFGHYGAGNGVAGVNVPNVVTTGVAATGASTDDTGTSVQAKITAEVGDANLLSGLITASDVKAVSSTSYDVSGLHARGGGSHFTALVVNGQSVSDNPAPNTTILLPGVGRVVLNEQTKAIGATTASLTVNMLHVYVTHNTSGVAKGTQILVAHATSGLTGDQAGSLEGDAYGTWAHSPGHTMSGRSALVSIGCGGTDGLLKTNSASEVSAPPELSTGTVTNTAQGTVTADSAIAETTSRVQAVNLLNGLVTADAVKADAHASKSGGVTTVSDTGSTFKNLVVNGQAMPSDVAPNTSIVVGNITIWLHRVQETDISIEVTNIEVVASGTNPYGLPDGTHIQVAVAAASAL
jgi:hypothetical protein